MYALTVLLTPNSSVGGHGPDLRPGFSSCFRVEGGLGTEAWISYTCLLHSHITVQGCKLAMAEKRGTYSEQIK